MPLGIAGATILAQHLLDVMETDDSTPILISVDTQGQLMARHDEMLGLNENIGHLAKYVPLASYLGHRTIGLEYGKAVAAAFSATALAILVGLTGAEPAVTDVPSMSRVTKLPEARLLELAKTTPVFAPGLDHMVFVGGVESVWDPARPLDAQLEQTLASASPIDVRDLLGAERRGRPMAADIAKKVIAAALGKTDFHAAA